MPNANEQALLWRDPERKISQFASHDSLQKISGKMMVDAALDNSESHKFENMDIEYQNNNSVQSEDIQTSFNSSFSNSTTQSFSPMGKTLGISPLYKTVNQSGTQTFQNQIHLNKRGRLPQSQHIQMRRSPLSSNQQPNQFQQLDTTPTKYSVEYESSPNTKSYKSNVFSTPEGRISNPTTPKSPLASLRNRIKEGNQYFKLEKYDKAIEVWMEALSDVPHHKGLLHNVATAYERMGQKDKAILWLRKSSELDNLASMMALGKALMNLKFENQEIILDNLNEIHEIRMKKIQSFNESTTENIIYDNKKLISENYIDKKINPNEPDDELEEAPNVSMDIDHIEGKRVPAMLTIKQKNESNMDVEDNYSTSSDDDSQQGDDDRLEAIKWFQKIIKLCGGKISSSETHNTDVFFWFDKSRSLFDKVIGQISQGEYHYHDNTILFSPSSPFKRTSRLSTPIDS